MSHQQIAMVMRRSAQVGGVLALLLWSGLAWRTSLLENVLLLGMGVCVPVGIWLVAQGEEGVPPLPLRALVWLQPLGVVLGLVSISLSHKQLGFVPAGLAGVWFLVTLCCGFWGLARLLKRGWHWDAELCIDAALGYIMVGGLSFVCAQGGWQLLGFDIAIIFLTAVHFHFAGFAAPLISGFVGRALAPGDAWGHRLHRFLVVSVVVLPGVIGVAFSRFPMLELVGVVIFAMALWCLGALLLGWVLPRQDSRLVQVLLGIAGLSILVSMVFACLYGYSKFSGQDLISISRMAQTHGVINALGFALCGLLAFAVAAGARSRR